MSNNFEQLSAKGDENIKHLEAQEKTHRNPNEKFKITPIRDNVYAVEWKKGNIDYFLNSEGWVIASPWASIELKNYEHLLKSLWYVEKKAGDEYVMYRLSDNTKLDKYSVEYFNIFSDIYFWEALKYMEAAQRYNLTEKQALELLPTFIDSWAFRIKDLMFHLEKWQITKEEFATYLPKLQKLLKSQCVDERGVLEKAWVSVTEQELKMYLEGGYIDKKTALELYEIIKKREEKGIHEKQIQRDTHASLTQERDLRDIS